MAVLVALFSASQDICIDAYRTDILEEHERGSGSAIFVSGYRLGMMMSGGLAMILAGHHVPWPAIYCSMGLAMVVGIGAVLIAPPAPSHIRPPATLEQAIVAPLKQILLRDRGWLIIAFVIIFKLPELMADRYTTPFLIDLKIPMETIGWIRQTFGLVVTIAGTLAGGWLVGRVGLYRSLWIVGLLQPLTNLAFFALAHYPQSRAVLVGVVGTESFCIGLVTAAFGAYLMSQCDPRYSAFQYALLSSAMAITRVVGVVPAGKFAQAYGWSAFFSLTIAIAAPGLLMLPLLRGSTIRQKPEEEPEPRGFEVIVAKEGDGGEAA
jgi:PAT family beta-lactamase induction signal transducer AmpG